MNTTYTPAQVEADLRRWHELAAVADQIASEQADIKARLATLEAGKHPFQAGTVSVSIPHRFSATKAKETLPDDIYASICVLKPSATQARKILGTALIDQLSEPGDPVVRIS